MAQAFRKLSIGEIPRLPAGLKLDPLGGEVWRELNSLAPGEALELEGRARDARRIGRAVAQFGREKGWALKTLSSQGNCYIVRLR